MCRASTPSLLSKQDVDGRDKPGHDDFDLLRDEMAARSSVREIQPLFDPFDPTIHTVKPVGKIGVLAFENAEPALYLAHVVAQAVNSTSDMPQVLQNDVIRFGHAYFHSIFVIS